MSSVKILVISSLSIMSLEQSISESSETSWKSSPDSGFFFLLNRCRWLLAFIFFYLSERFISFYHYFFRWFRPNAAFAKFSFCSFLWSSFWSSQLTVFSVETISKSIGAVGTWFEVMFSWSTIIGFCSGSLIAARWYTYVESKSSFLNINEFNGKIPVFSKPDWILRGVNDSL